MSRVSRSLRRNGPTLALALLTLFLTYAVVGFVIVPGWMAPTNRTYTSRLGRAAWLRSQGRPFPVRSARVEVREITEVVLGDGMMQSEPVAVPIVPLASVLEVRVRSGDVVAQGELLALLDTRRLEIKIEAARAAVERLQLELEHTRVGSASSMAFERTESFEISRTAAAEQLRIQSELIDTLTDLVQRGFVPRMRLVEARQAMVESERRLQEAELALGTGEAGRELSIQVKRKELEEARLALRHLELERADYEVRAPIGGIVDRVLVHPGDFNQNPGKPGFTLAAGLWFETHLDQSAIGRVAGGDECEVRLEAFPGLVLEGFVEHVEPFVSFDLGGPEVNRPIRAMGSSSPQWPATFAARVQVVAPSGTELVPGLTGFARLENRRSVLAVPRSSLLSMSGGTAMVWLLQGEHHDLREVRVGSESDAWVEILAGLRAGDVVLSEGQRVLEPGDRIVVLGADGAQ